MPTQNSTPIDQRGHPDITWHGTHSLEERENIIREAAYHLYEQRGCAQGHHVDDWLAAEAALDHGNPEMQSAGLTEFEIQQSGFHSPRADDALKHISKKHPQSGTPLVESD